MRQAVNAKQGRISELRSLYRRTGSMESVVERCKQWGVSPPTIRDYTKQVIDDLTKNEIKRRKLIIAQRMSKTFSTNYD